MRTSRKSRSKSPQPSYRSRSPSDIARENRRKSRQSFKTPVNKSKKSNKSDSSLSFYHKKAIELIVSSVLLSSEVKSQKCIDKPEYQIRITNPKGDSKYAYIKPIPRVVQMNTAQEMQLLRNKEMRKRKSMSKDYSDSYRKNQKRQRLQKLSQDQVEDIQKTVEMADIFLNKKITQKRIEKMRTTFSKYFVFGQIPTARNPVGVELLKDGKVLASVVEILTSYASDKIRYKMDRLKLFSDYEIETNYDEFWAILKKHIEVFTKYEKEIESQQNQDKEKASSSSSEKDKEKGRDLLIPQWKSSFSKVGNLNWVADKKKAEDDIMKQSKIESSQSQSQHSEQNQEQKEKKYKKVESKSRERNYSEERSEQSVPQSHLRRRQNIKHSQGSCFQYRQCKKGITKVRKSARLLNRVNHKMLLIQRQLKKKRDQPKKVHQEKVKIQFLQKAKPSIYDFNKKLQNMDRQQLKQQYNSCKQIFDKTAKLKQMVITDLLLDFEQVNIQNNFVYPQEPITKEDEKIEEIIKRKKEETKSVESQSSQKQQSGQQSNQQSEQSNKQQKQELQKQKSSQQKIVSKDTDSQPSQQEVKNQKGQDQKAEKRRFLDRKSQEQKPESKKESIQKLSSYKQQNEKVLRQKQQDKRVNYETMVSNQFHLKVPSLNKNQGTNISATSSVVQSSNSNQDSKYYVDVKSHEYNAEFVDNQDPQQSSELRFAQMLKAKGKIQKQHRMLQKQKQQEQRLQQQGRKVIIYQDQKNQQGNYNNSFPSKNDHRSHKKQPSKREDIVYYDLQKKDQFETKRLSSVLKKQVEDIPQSWDQLKREIEQSNNRMMQTHGIDYKVVQRLQKTSDEMEEARIEQIKQKIRKGTAELHEGRQLQKLEQQREQKNYEKQKEQKRASFKIASENFKRQQANFEKEEELKRDSLLSKKKKRQLEQAKQKQKQEFEKKMQSIRENELSKLKEYEARMSQKVNNSIKEEEKKRSSIQNRILSESMIVRGASSNQGSQIIYQDDSEERRQTVQNQETGIKTIYMQQNDDDENRKSSPQKSNFDPQNIKKNSDRSFLYPSKRKFQPNINMPEEVGFPEQISAILNRDSMSISNFMNQTSLNQIFQVDQGMESEESQKQQQAVQSHVKSLEHRPPSSEDYNFKKKPNPPPQAYVLETPKKQVKDTQQNVRQFTTEKHQQNQEEQDQEQEQQGGQEQQEQEDEEREFYDLITTPPRRKNRALDDFIARKNAQRMLQLSNRSNRSKFDTRRKEYMDYQQISSHYLKQFPNDKGRFKSQYQLNVSSLYQFAPRVMNPRLLDPVPAKLIYMNFNGNKYHALVQLENQSSIQYGFNYILTEIDLRNKPNIAIIKADEEQAYKITGQKVAYVRQTPRLREFIRYTYPVRRPRTYQPYEFKKPLFNYRIYEGYQ